MTALPYLYKYAAYKSILIEKSYRVYTHKICYHVALKANSIVYEIQDFMSIDLLLKRTRPALIFVDFI